MSLGWFQTINAAQKCVTTIMEWIRTLLFFKSNKKKIVKKEDKS